MTGAHSPGGVCCTQSPAVQGGYPVSCGTVNSKPPKLPAAQCQTSCCQALQVFHVAKSSRNLAVWGPEAALPCAEALLLCACGTPQYLAKTNPSPATKGHKSPVPCSNCSACNRHALRCGWQGGCWPSCCCKAFPACADPPLCGPACDHHRQRTGSRKQQQKRCSRHLSIRSRPQQWMPLCVVWSSMMDFRFSAVPGAVCRATAALTQSPYKTMI